MQSVRTCSTIRTIIAAVSIASVSCVAQAPATQFTQSYVTAADRAINDALGDPQAKTRARTGMDPGVRIGNSYTSTFPVEALRGRGIDRGELLRRIRGSHENELATLGLTFERATDASDDSYELRYQGAGRKGALRGSIREVAENVELLLELGEEPEFE